MDQLPFVAPIYKRDLKTENYFSGYLKHPYVSIYTGRGFVPPDFVSLNPAPTSVTSVRYFLLSARMKRSGKRTSFGIVSGCSRRRS
jgi:hypothetical protein